MCQIKSVRVGHKEQFGTSICGLRPHKLCADAHIYSCAGNLCGSSFDPHHLSIAKMSSSVQTKSRRRGSFSNDNTMSVTGVLISNVSLKRSRSKGAGLSGWF